MENLFNNVLKIITDKTTSFTKRALYAILFLGLAILINDTFKFTYNYRTNQKISQLKTIYEIIPDSNRARENLSKIEAEIIASKPIVDIASEIFKDLLTNSLTKAQKDIVYRLLSGSAVFILFAFVYPFIENDKTELWLFYIGLSFIGVVMNWLLFFLPTFEYIIINHIINIGTPIIGIILILVYSKDEPEVTLKQDL